jgi:hypothetical protein
MAPRKCSRMQGQYLWLQKKRRARVQALLGCSDRNCCGKQQKIRRVGKLAHGPLRSRCPRAAPNPSLGDYAPPSRATMGHQSHSTGYPGSSTKCQPFHSLEAAGIGLSHLIVIRYIYSSLLIPSPLPRIVLLPARLHSKPISLRLASGIIPG